MNELTSNGQFTAQVFSDRAREEFADCYPEKPRVLTHNLAEHALLTLPALAELGAALPKKYIEYNPGDLPVGIAPEDVPTSKMSIAETILNVETSASWAVLKNIEQIPAYEALLLSLLEEIRPVLEKKTGAMLRPQGFIFVSSPNAMTPYHFDPEHNILLQLRGSKAMTVYPAGVERYAPATVHETYHRGGPRNLTWQEDFQNEGRAYILTPGKAIFVPVMAPHFVRNGPKPSISLSITWRSDWSFAEADAHAFNAMLRRWGMKPKMPKRFPAMNRGKSLSWRVLRKTGLVS